MNNKALLNLKIVDLTHYIAGPYCTKLMALVFGANVIKVERPKTGDNLRGIGPFFKNEQGVERSIPFLWLNTGERKSFFGILSQRKEKKYLNDWC